MPDDAVERVIRRADKALVLSDVELRQPVAFRNGRFYTLHEYYAWVKNREDGAHLCPRIDDLTDRELAELVKERVKTAEVEPCLVYHGRKYGRMQLLEAIGMRVGVGDEIILQHRTFLDYMEGMIDAGKAKLPY